MEGWKGRAVRGVHLVSGAVVASPTLAGFGPRRGLIRGFRRGRL
jgi:hypothetical protein